MPYGEAIQRRVNGPTVMGTGTAFNPRGKKNNGGKKGKGGIPSIQKFLGGDADYKATIDALRRNFEQTKIQNVSNRGNLRQDFDTTTGRLQDQQQKSIDDLQADFAARGLFGSGLSLKAENDQNLDFQDRLTDAETSFQRNLSQLLTDLANARSSFRENKRQAKLNAIRRRAERFGIRR